MSMDDFNKAKQDYVKTIADEKASLSRVVSMVRKLKEFECELFRVDYNKIGVKKSCEWFTFNVNERVESLKKDFFELYGDEKDAVTGQFGSVSKDTVSAKIDVEIDEVLECDIYDGLSVEVKQFLVGTLLFDSYLLKIFGYSE